MDRFTISLDEDLAATFDELIKERGYENRSEAVRDILRDHLQQRAAEQKVASHCVAALSYVYSHHERDLAERLAALQHEHHDLTVATTHVHLNHEECIENVILQGRTASVRRFADRLVAERGVRHGKLNLVSVDRSVSHSHGGDRHQHSKPRF